MLDALREVAGWVKQHFWAKTDNIILRAGQFLRVGNSQLKDDKLGIGTTSPQHKMDVRGPIRSRPLGTANGGAFMQGLVNAETSYTRAWVGNNAYWNDSTDTWVLTNYGANDAGGILFENGSAISFLTVPTTGNVQRTLTHSEFLSYRRMTINTSGDVGIGTTAPDAELDVFGRIKSHGPMGWYYNKSSVAHNTATNIARIDVSDSTTLMLLVTVRLAGTGRLATKLFSVATAWSTEVVTDLGGALHDYTALTLTAAMDTANRRLTLTVTQTNPSSEAASVGIFVQPVGGYTGDTLVSFTGL